MNTSELLRWQWEGYARYHRSRTNLILHLVLVPLFILSNLVLLRALLARSFFAEQWITFPRFVLSGGWLRALRESE